MYLTKIKMFQFFFFKVKFSVTTGPRTSGSAEKDYYGFTGFEQQTIQFLQTTVHQHNDLLSVISSQKS